MTAPLRVALPTEYWPRYLCPTCDYPLVYDDAIDPETHERTATCAVGHHAFIITATATQRDHDTGRNASMEYTMTELHR